MRYKAFFSLFIQWIISAHPLHVFSQEAYLEQYIESPEKNHKTTIYIDGLIKQAGVIGEKHQDSALRLLDVLFKESRRLQYNDGMFNALLKAGSILVNYGGNPAHALYFFRKAYPYCQADTFENGKAIVRWNICMGSAFSRLQAYDSTMLYFYRALDIMLKNDWKNKKEMLMQYINMGITLFDFGQYEKSNYYTQKAYNLALLLDDKKELVRIYAIFCTAFVHQKKYDSAGIYLKKVYNLNVPIIDAHLKVFKEIQGVIYLEQGFPERAIPLFLETSNINDKDPSIGYYRLGSSYFYLKDYSKAEYYYKKALSIPEKTTSTQYLIYENLSKLYDSSGKYQQAYVFKAKAAALNDSINNLEKAKIINQLETKYRTSEKDKEITTTQLQLTTAENKLNKKNLWIAGIASSALILLLSGAFLFQRQRLKLQRTKTAEEQLKVNQLKAIIEAEEKERSRIGRQLHDDVMVEFSIVKMNLAALPYQYPEVKKIADYKNIEQQLKHASIKLRQTAHNLMPDALLEEGLLSAINYFCTGVQKTSGIRIRFEPDGPIRLPLDTEISLYRIIQELIQNVIKHADATQVMILLNYSGEHLRITVADNGKGIQNRELAESGMGLKSIRTRLQTINGTMEINEVKPHGASVQIEVAV